MKEIVERYENGNIKEKYTIDENGLKDGLYQQFHFNKKLFLECNFKNGLKNGIETVYHPNGRKSRETNYKNGLKDGIEREYFLIDSNLIKSDRVKRECVYDKNKLIFLREFFLNGKIYKEKTFV